MRNTGKIGLSDYGNWFPGNHRRSGKWRRLIENTLKFPAISYFVHPIKPVEEQTEPSIFEEIHDPFAVRRKYMAPKWIRFFAWVFAILCPLQLLFSVSVIMLRSLNALPQFFPRRAGSVVTLWDLVTIGSIVIRGTAAIGLLKEKDWAMKLCIANGFLGIAICIYSLVMFPWTVTVYNGSFTTTHYYLIIDLLILIPYLVNVVRIRKDWEENRYATQQGM